MFINGVMLNAYPDSIGTGLADTVELLKRPEFKGAFSLFYILPTFFNSDLDRGFSIINYDLNRELISEQDLKDLQDLGIMLKLDLILNHLSVNSPQFQDLLAKGEQSAYNDFFIDWNKFWQGCGTTGEEGYIIPYPEYLQKLFMRKPGLPVMKICFPGGINRFFWNTFYQEIRYAELTPSDYAHYREAIVSIAEQKRSYLGQLDLNARSEKVWAFYEQTMKKLSKHGAKIVRLDAFAYLHKAVGETNFFNRPGTWAYLEKLKEIANRYDLIVFPEIHAEYGSGLHEEVAQKGYPIYDFFFPGLVIDAIERGTNRPLLKWIDDIMAKGLKTINMLGCHDGIPLLDLRGKVLNGISREGLLSDEQIDALVELVTSRGGRIKNLYGPDGKKISYYQVNATFFSALGEDERKLRLARAIQLFMPGIPQVWYLDLFAGKNNYTAADRGGPAGHKEINRTTLSHQDLADGLERPIVQDQLKMIRLRNSFPAFNGRFTANHSSTPFTLNLNWENGGYRAALQANLRDHSFQITHQAPSEKPVSLIFT